MPIRVSLLAWWQHYIHNLEPDLSLLQSLRHRLPVDNLPDGLEVLGLPVLVLEVVGVFPGIDTQQRHIVASNGILVGTRDDLQGASRLVLGQPGPAGALDAGQGRVDLGLEGVEAAEVALDSLGQRTLGDAAATLVRRGKVLPEQAVVDVASTVEVEGRGQATSLEKVTSFFGLRDGLERRVEVVDVGLVVALVVDLHDLTADMRLEGAVVVWRV